ncbi:MAG: FAD-binding oxidoreductase [Deltaproteobacteria bacterium]|nr:FAD-binding oxidoreductase [Deltaproteobacteria bacterium]
MRETVTGWGLYPSIKAIQYSPTSSDEVIDCIKSQKKLISRGFGRSYGDSALFSTVLNSKHRDFILDFDTKEHLIKVCAGISIAELLPILVSKGYFLPVVPGTKYITIGGAVACDIHGKNHHSEGTFTKHVKSLTLVDSDGKKITCSRDQNSQLFYATCGGMGLTGYIDEVVFDLKQIKSSKISMSSHKAKNLSELYDLFERYKQSTYSVAWIDCLAKGKKMGRGVFMEGEHNKLSNDLSYHPKKKLIHMPMMPTWFLNTLFVKMFNFFYFHKQFPKIVYKEIDIDPFFFPLDAVSRWNRMYGKKGFTQYQCVLPDPSREGMEIILKTISESSMGSFLAVLKRFGPANKNFLSFPIEGYTLALDFKLSDKVFALLKKLDEITLQYNGRVYLTKDVRLSKEDFEKMYLDGLKNFRRMRSTYGRKFHSIQSERLGL